MQGGLSRRGEDEGHGDSGQGDGARSGVHAHGPGGVGWARDDKGVGTLFYNGTLPDAAAAVFLKLYANDQLIKTQMAAAWKTDFPNLKNYYVFQIWPNSCSMGGRDGSALICDFSPTRQQRNESPQNQFVLQLAPIALKA